MFEVRVFNSKGKLKKIIPPKKLIALRDEAFGKQISIQLRGLKKADYKAPYSDYKCTTTGCGVIFQSNSTRGALYCIECRKGASKRCRDKKKRQKDD